jgi:hypothetical protein
MHFFWQTELCFTVLDNTVPRNEDVETSDEVGSSENSCDNSAGNVFAISNDGVSSEEQQNDLFEKENKNTGMLKIEHKLANGGCITNQQTSQKYFNVSCLF